MKIRSISIFHSITKTREEKDLTLKLAKDILNLEDIMNSAPSELIQSSLNKIKNRVGKERGGKGRGYTSPIKGKLA
jgi:hypothetical protein